MSQDSTARVAMGLHDPVALAVVKRLDEQIESGEIEIPRMPHVAAAIFELVRDPDVNMGELVLAIRKDPVLSGRLLAVANSAQFAGAQPAKDLKAAVVRLGLNSIAQESLQLTANMKHHRAEKRRNLLKRLWKYSFATAIASEELARQCAEPPAGAFPAGLLHAIAAPVIVQEIGRLERLREVPEQSDSRVLAALRLLTPEQSARIVGHWNLGTELADAIRLQERRLRDRRGKPLAHLVVAAKALAAHVGVGVRPIPLDLDACRDFKHLLLGEAKVKEAKKFLREKTGPIASL